MQAGDALSPHIIALRRLERAAQDEGWLTGCNPGRLMDLIMALEDAGDAALPAAWLELGLRTAARASGTTTAEPAEARRLRRRGCARESRHPHDRTETP